MFNLSLVKLSRIHIHTHTHTMPATTSPAVSNMNLQVTSGVAGISCVNGLPTLASFTKSSSNSAYGLSNGYLISNNGYVNGNNSPNSCSSSNSISNICGIMSSSPSVDKVATSSMITSNLANSISIATQQQCLQRLSSTAHQVVNSSNNSSEKVLHAQ